MCLHCVKTGRDRKVCYCTLQHEGNGGRRMPLAGLLHYDKYCVTTPASAAMDLSNRFLKVSTAPNGHASNCYNGSPPPPPRATLPRRQCQGYPSAVCWEEPPYGKPHSTLVKELKSPVDWIALPNMPGRWAAPRKSSIWCLSLQQGTVLAGLSSTIFALLIFVHEVVIEGGFDARNYVVLAFCVIWLIVTAMLFVAVYKVASFMLLPWLVLTCILTPLFMVAIVAGGKVIGLCLHNVVKDACSHEQHIFGTVHHFTASVKLGVLIFMTVTNSVFLFVVYRYFCTMNSKSQSQCKTIWLKGEVPQTKPMRYHRIRDSSDVDSQEPLFHPVQDCKIACT